MRRLTPIVVLLLCLLPVAGCWDRREVNDMALVIAMAMDKEPNGQYRLSVQVPLVSSLGSTSGEAAGRAVTSLTMLIPLWARRSGKRTILFSRGCRVNCTTPTIA